VLPSELLAPVLHDSAKPVEVVPALGASVLMDGQLPHLRLMPCLL
jgi:hypothetical protein